MCGIVGWLNKEQSIEVNNFEEMRDTLTHRGPDGFGTYLYNDNKIALGHRRLSLVDLSEAGKQPLTNEDSTLWLTANCEIYNYIELKQELIGKGHKFSSATDAEVIIHAFEEWGEDMLSKLDGMFSFALFNEKTNSLFLARDRFGIKPLYYNFTDKHFIFASEPKAIIKSTAFTKEIDYSSVCDFFVYRYVPSPKSIWKNVFKLPPAHFLTFNFEKFEVEKIKQYWSLESKSKTLSSQKFNYKFEELLQQSVSTHLRSDVLIGSFLSGGFDSSTMVYLMDKIKYPINTYSIGFENWEQSEHIYAQQVANIFNSKHSSSILEEKHREELSSLSFFYDEPCADISVVPTFFVSQLASKSVKAVVSGEGADELLGGYHWQQSFYKYISKLSLIDKFKLKFFNQKKHITVEKYAEAMAMGNFDAALLKQMLHPNLHNNIPNDSLWFYKKHFKKCLSPLKTFQWLDIHTFMSELILTKVDRASMANSLEVRVPFLDHHIAEFVFAQKENVYFDPNFQKKSLFNILKNYLPVDILYRKKQGFVGPDSYYSNVDWYKQFLIDGTLVNDNIIQKQFVEKLIIEKDHWRLWKILVFEFWYKQWK